MKIAINTFPLDSMHAGRGIGQYTDLLLKGLKQYDKKNSYVYFQGDLNGRVDIVHYPFFDIFQSTLNFIPHTKTVVTVHDLIPLKYPGKFPAGIRGKIAWWRQKNRLEKVDAVITDSEASAHDIEAITNIPRNKIHIVPLAVSQEYKKLNANEINKRELEKYNLPKDFLLYVGDVNWNKNIQGLIKSFAGLLRDSEYSSVQLVLVGSAFLKEKLNEVQEINKVVRDEGVEKNVRMLGFIPTSELVAIFNLARAYIQPSFDEGFGLTVLEALACGTLIASSNKGSLPEVVGDAGEYFDPYSSHDTVEAIKKVLNLSDSESEKRIQQGYLQASEFTIKNFAEQTIHVYEILA